MMQINAFQQNVTKSISESGCEKRIKYEHTLTSKQTLYDFKFVYIEDYFNGNKIEFDCVLDGWCRERW